MKEKLLSILSSFFAKPVDENISMDNEDIWDSMKHIELVMILEEEFDISINPMDIPNIRDFNSILKKIEELSK